MAKTYARIERFVAEYPWAIIPEALDSILEILSLRAEGHVFTDEEIQARIGASPPPVRKNIGAVAVLPVFGVIAHRMNLLTAMSGGMSTEQLASAVRAAAADPAITAICLDVDSPGGSVFGVQELADEIFRARGTKPIMAVANATAASAAYWIASQADEMVITPSGQVGSIGVVAVHVDRSKQAELLGLKHTMISAGAHKTDGNDLAPLDEDTRAHMQRRVDQYYSAFVKAVARGRGVTAEDVRGGFGEGRVVAAADAMKARMVDGIRTMDDVLDRLASGARSISGGPRAALDPKAPQIDPDEDGNCPEGYRKTEDGLCEPVAKAEVPPFKLQAETIRRQLAERGA